MKLIEIFTLNKTLKMEFSNRSLKCTQIAMQPQLMTILSLQNQISWIRRRDWHILSSGAQLYTNDERFGIIHTPGSNTWTLQIKFVQRRDNGLYECQVCVCLSPQPPQCMKKSHQLFSGGRGIDKTKQKRLLVNQGS